MATNGAPEQPANEQPPGEQAAGGLFGIPAKWLIIGGAGGGGVLLVVIVVAVLLVVLGGGGDIKAEYIDDCTDSRRGWDLDDDVCQCGWAIVEHDFNKDALEEIEDARRLDITLEQLYREAAGYCDATQNVKRSLRPEIGENKKFGGLDSDIEEDYLETCDDLGIDQEVCQCGLDIMGGDFDDDTFEELEDEGQAQRVLDEALGYCAGTERLPRRLRPDR